MVKKPKIVPKDDLIGLGIIVLVVIAMVILASYSTIPVTEKFPASINSSTPGKPFFSPGIEFLEQNVLRVDGTSVTIGRDCLAIISSTSSERAEAIQLGISGIVPSRPVAYDGWANMLHSFNITFEAVTLTSFDNEAYFSRAIFAKGVQVLDLDMKPSDAIALALRTETPIYINMTMLREVGKSICQ
jgi:bifunctional DNase/RNase